jgi:hypothetical protein
VASAPHSRPRCTPCPGDSRRARRWRADGRVRYDGRPLARVDVVSGLSSHGLALVGGPQEGSGLPFNPANGASTPPSALRNATNNGGLSLPFSDRATPLVGGATHDLTALRDANLPAHLAASELDVLADSGFQGLQHHVPTVELPTRRRRKDEPLTIVERFFNKVLSSNRVRVEHAIGRLKQWRCLTVHKQRRDLLERWLPVCWALTSYQQAWPRS